MISVLLVSDTIIREGLRSLLEAEADIRVVEEAETGEQAVSMVRMLQPDVVLMDIVTPGTSSVEAMRRIVRESPRTRVLMLSSHTEDESVLQSIEAGAAGYLSKQASVSDIVNAIREVRDGNIPLSPEISKRLIDQYRRSLLLGIPVKRRVDLLTPREMDVLRLIAGGGRNRYIAARLGISLKTVDRHRQQIMNKLDIHDVAGLTRYALANGLIEPDSRAEDR